MRARLGVVAVAASVSIAALPACSTSPASATITVAAAASLADVLPAIGEGFTEANPEATVRFTFAGSNALVEQVRAQAPIDVLVTASEATMLATVDLVDEPVAVARNAMAIVVPPGNAGGVRSLADLSRVGTALCVDQVPCGAASRELLARSGVRVEPVTRELDVRAVLGKVMADQVDAGIVYATDARAAGDDVETISIPLERNVETAYLAAAVSAAATPAVAAAFVDYLSSPAAQAVLRDAGFGAP